jgi:hypothetical protein
MVIDLRRPISMISDDERSDDDHDDAGVYQPTYY